MIDWCTYFLCNFPRPIRWYVHVWRLLREGGKSKSRQSLVALTLYRPRRFWPFNAMYAGSSIKVPRWWNNLSLRYRLTSKRARDNYICNTWLFGRHSLKWWEPCCHWLDASLLLSSLPQNWIRRGRTGRKEFKCWRLAIICRAMFKAMARAPTLILWILIAVLR